MSHRHSLRLPMQTSETDGTYVLTISRRGSNATVSVSLQEELGTTELVSMAICSDGHISMSLSSALDPANLAALKFAESVNARPV